ncbi:MAG: fibronectin type III domain-containing protein [Kofleriaceae bacterium]|nr:fibronectin type III domain-containing protein [Kofleriaceae bacterium]
MGPRVQLLARRAALGAAVLAGAAAQAHANTCRTLAVDFLPAESPNADVTLRKPLQIVAWLETADGTYVDTIFITQAVGSFGIGNRPGRFDFNSGPLWPYGRRITVFPVWAHKKPLDFPELGFQDGNENNLSHAAGESSAEKRYCAPLHRSEPEWDTGTCATVGYTDKGKFTGRRSLYPPRTDHQRDREHDSRDLEELVGMNPFDAVSRATPTSGVPAQLVWSVPDTLPLGEYVLWMEVAREFDPNASHDYPAPTGISFADFGIPYRGQPSVIYKTPITISANEAMSTTDRYAGYGDPDGLDGDVRAPDSTISVDVPGSGGARLAIVPGGGYRLRTVSRSELDTVAPGEMAGLAVTASTFRSITLDMIAPGDDGLVGPITGYEVRYAIGAPITEETFAEATDIKPTIDLVGPGELQTITLDRLLPETTYTIAIRALDNCGNTGPIATIEAATSTRTGSEVDACFIATAAYGSAMAAEIQPLRAFRDHVLRKSVLGELAVQTYYTFGPAVAGVMGESELLRATARAALAPVVTTVRSLRWLPAGTGSR